jgi:glycosyltransferase involved in cell wall biosynthesis
MNIVSITDSLGESAGGLSNATFNLAISTAAHLPQDHLIILSSKDTLEVDTHVVLPSNCRVIKQGCYRNPIYPLAPALYKRLIHLNPDLLHLRGLWRQASSVALKWKNNHPHKKLIVQAAGMLEPWARKRNGLLKKIRYSLVELPLFKLCDAIHATSKQEADHLISLGMDQAKIVIIEEGIFIPKIPRKLPRDGQPKTLLFLSRLHPKKGIEMLLDAWSLLRPVGWKCKIVGMGDQAYVEFLRSKCSHQGLSDVIDFVGPLYGAEKRDSLMHAESPQPSCPTA